MSKPTRKTRQHYVPRLILRNFSLDARNVALYLVGRGKAIGSAPLRHQCYEDYFYGRDGGIEDAFSRVEGRFAAALGDLSRDHLNALSDAELDDVRLFMHYQRLRTRGAADEVDHVTDAMAKLLLSKDGRLKEVDLRGVHIRSKYPQIESLHHAMTSFPLVLDLGIKFLISDKRLGFVVSDDPAASYNQFVEHHPLLGRHPGGATGIAVKGLQVFLPVSPRVCLSLYDTGTYAFGSPKRLTCDLSINDIRLVNVLQAANAVNCLYYDPSVTPEEELTRLRRQRERHKDWRAPRLLEGPISRRPDGKLSQLVVNLRGDLRIGAKFGFALVTDHEAYEHYNRAFLPVRSEALLDLADQYKEFIKSKIQEAHHRREGSVTVRETDSEED